MSEFFSTLYYGNTVTQWAMAFGIILLSVLLGRAIYWIFGRWVKFMTRKTKTTLDDLIVDMIEEPVVAMLILVGIRLSFNILILPETVENWPDRLFSLALSLFVAWLITRLYDAFHREYLIPLAAKTEADLDDQLLPVIRTGIKAAVWALGLIIGLNNAGYDVGAVLAGLGIGGLAFALAAQDTVSNMFGGITIFLQRPFTLGDRIAVNGKEGYVREIGLRTTVLVTAGLGEKIWIPNKFFIENPITNLDNCNFYFRFEMFYLHRETTVQKIETFIEKLKEIAEAHQDIVWAAPLLDKVGEYSFEIKCKYGVYPWAKGQIYSDHYEKLDCVRSYLNLNALKLLNELQIELAVPVVHTTTPNFPLPLLPDKQALHREGNSLTVAP